MARVHTATERRRYNYSVRRCRHRGSLGLRAKRILQIAMVLVPGAEHEQEYEYDYDALFRWREDEQIEKAFHFSAYRIGSTNPASRNPASLSRQESHSPHASPFDVGS